MAPRSIRTEEEEGRFARETGESELPVRESRHARPDAERGCEPDGRAGCSREAVFAAVVCGVRAQRAFEDLKPAEVVLIPYLRTIEQIRKGDVEAGNEIKVNMAQGGPT